VLAVEHGCWGSDRYFRPLLEEFANFHIDTANYELDGGIPALVRKYGAERIIYGSSFHNRPMGGASLLLRNVDIDPASRELIAHGNLERLLKGVRL
jgi:predicted TIM-barrel fold metal-dependent hydrolase